MVSSSVLFMFSSWRLIAKMALPQLKDSCFCYMSVDDDTDDHWHGHNDCAMDTWKELARGTAPRQPRLAQITEWNWRPSVDVTMFNIESLQHKIRIDILYFHLTWNRSRHAPMHHTGIKLWLSDQTSDHHKVVPWYHENNRHYLANYSQSRFVNKINSNYFKFNHG